jgi:outer membrane lipoprotein SlyB
MKLSTFTRFALALTALTTIIFTTGCALSPTNDRYNRHEAMQKQNEEAGTIAALRPVRIHGEALGVGAMIGASVGGGVGSHIGKGTGARINSGLGGVAGAILGGVVEERLSQSDATEVSVRLSDGKLISVVIPGKLDFAQGTAVRVLSGHGATRVIAVTPPAPAPSADGASS